MCSSDLFCITVDFETVGDEKTPADGCVTVRERDTMQQVRIPISELKAYLTVQALHGASAPQLPPYVGTEGTNICPLGANCPKNHYGQPKFQNLQLINPDGARFAFHFLPRPSQLVQLLPVHLQGRIHGRHLHIVSHKALRRGKDLLPARDRKSVV